METAVLLTIVMFLIASFPGAAGNEGSTSGTPGSIGGADCGLEQRVPDVDGVLDLATDTEAATALPLSLPDRPVVAPGLNPVDREVVTEVVAAANAMRDCFASHQPLRGVAGFSDGFLRRIVAADGPDATRSALAILSDPAAQSLVAFSAVGQEAEAGRLDDVRVALTRVVSYDLPANAELAQVEITVMFVFVESGNGWLMDDILFTNTVVNGTPMP